MSTKAMGLELGDRPNDGNALPFSYRILVLSLMKEATWTCYTFVTLARVLCRNSSDVMAPFMSGQRSSFRIMELS